MTISRVLPLTIVLLCGLRAEAQYNPAIDVSKCYADILQQSNSWQNDSDLHYRLMTTLTREDYESLKASGRVTAFLPGLAVDAPWEVAKATATKLIQTHDETLITTQHTYSAVKNLDPQATDIFRTCVQGLVSNHPYGLFYYVTHTAPDTAQVEVVWKWIEGRKIKIKSSTIDNGYIAGTNPHQKTLFADTTANNWFPPTISQAAPFIIKFDDPNQDVNIALRVDPEVIFEPIVIPHLPLRKKCTTVWSTSANDIPFTRVVEFVPEQHFTGLKKGGGDGFSYSETIDGVVTEITCNKVNQSHIELDLANGASVASGYGVGTNVAKCDGWQNATPRRVLMSYSWKKDHTDCEQEVPWPKSN
jgi:hypothetical protein